MGPHLGLSLSFSMEKTKTQKDKWKVPKPKSQDSNMNFPHSKCIALVPEFFLPHTGAKNIMVVMVVHGGPHTILSTSGDKR